MTCPLAAHIVPFILMYSIYLLTVTVYFRFKTLQPSGTYITIRAGIHAARTGFKFYADINTRAARWPVDVDAVL
ncbi:hypothetical protein C8R45DRAFT_1114547 [Mycena sanguinolenta]|nr:hypothetical protein C8R45DRAFT_1114547 [Mycena sanguinolenta]